MYQHKALQLVQPLFYMKNKRLLLHGNCVSEMQKIQNDSVSLILTDPPYNLGIFMKKRETILGALREKCFVFFTIIKLYHKILYFTLGVKCVTIYLVFSWLATNVHYYLKGW